MSAKHVFLKSINKWALLNQPVFASPIEGVALLVCCHGAGECGSTEADLSKLYANGLPVEMNTGVIHPFTGGMWAFNTLTIQDTGYQTDPAELLKAIDEIKPLLSRYDANTVFVTGLSQGGARSMRALSNNDAIKVFAAGVPMSPSEPFEA